MDQGQHHEGTLARTNRSFRQDAEQSMGSEPIRALVELITNADDAYDATPGTRRGKIRIEVERRRRPQETILRVLDRACGMTRAEMEAKLGREGLRTSGFEVGENRRGLLG